MIRAWLIAAAIGGFLSVAAGAAAAHIAAGERAAELLRSGALYGMVHAAALIAVTAIAQPRSRLSLALTTAGCSFAGGMLVFSISLFALALTGREWLGMITPFGGAGLLVGWAALAVHASTRR
ncbi:MAG TPA: DUF423 domain-containing protein [Stellaceae bacterium]